MNHHLSSRVGGDDPFKPQDVADTNGSFKLPESSMSNMVCFRPADYDKIYSNGIFSGEDPLNFSLPVLMCTLVLLFVVCKSLYFLLRPLKQPRIVCDIIGGIILGPSVMGQGFLQSYSDWYLKQKNLPMFRVLAFFGLMYHLFIIGVKIDPTTVLTMGKKAWIVAAGSMIAPLALGGLTANLLRSYVKVSIAKGHFYFFLPASLSITAFPVVADILTELGLLNSELGRLAMAASLLNGMLTWFLMASFSAQIQSQDATLNGVYSILSLAGVILLLVFVFRPATEWIIRNTPKGGRVKDGYVATILMLVACMGLLTDAIGASAVTGPLLMGLVVPDGPPLGAAIVKRVEAVMSEVFMPLVFLVSGQVTYYSAIRGVSDWWAFEIIIVVCYIGKMVGTVGAGIYCKLPPLKAVILGLMMSFRGLIEIMQYLNFRNGQLIDNENFTMIITSTVLVTGTVVPLVQVLYSPLSAARTGGRRNLQNTRGPSELRVLACVHCDSPIPTIISLLESSCPDGHPLCAYVLHIVELVGRATSSLLSHKNKKGFINPTNMDPMLNAFIHYEQHKKGRAAIQPFTALAPFRTMHHDVCSLAEEKSTALIVLPFPRKDSVEGPGTDLDQAMRGIIPDVLERAPCTVGILIYLASSYAVMPSPGQFRLYVGVLFWGGPDDREAVAYALRMARHAGVNISALRFVPTVDRRDESQRHMDDGLMADLRDEAAANDRVKVEEAAVRDVEETIAAIRGIDKEFDLVIVGRRQGRGSFIEEGLAEWSEHPELGVVGDMLASNDFNFHNAVLVLQHG